MEELSAEVPHPESSQWSEAPEAPEAAEAAGAPEAFSTAGESVAQTTKCAPAAEAREAAAKAACSSSQGAYVGVALHSSASTPNIQAGVLGLPRSLEGCHFCSCIVNGQ